MAPLSRSGWLLLLLTFVGTRSQKDASLRINSKCLGNVLRVDVGPLGAKLLQVSVDFNNQQYPLTPEMQSRCGFSMKKGQFGNFIIYATLQNCFAHNRGDNSFTTTLNLHLYGGEEEDDDVYKVSETCHYQTWASREIICAPNFMEVSVERKVAEDAQAPANPGLAVKKLLGSEYKFTTVVFHTPAELSLRLEDAQDKGYGIGNTPSRLVLRSPLSTQETYTQTVAGVFMNILKTSAVYKKQWLASQIEAAAVCPVAEGSVFFSETSITWYLPHHIDPLISSNQFKLLEVHMGVDGEILDSAEMDNRRYSLSVEDAHIVVQIPIGAVGGHFKSQVQNDQYLSTYTIEPMLELLWADGLTQDQTRYKVLMPITTPPLSRPPQVVDETIPEKRMFKVLVGPFGLDVALKNVAFPNEVLSLQDCQLRGFNIQEMPSEGGAKVFSIQVPFTDRVITRRKGKGSSDYILHLTLGLLVTPELTPFSHSVYLEANVVDIVAPSSTGHCDDKSFILLVQYGSEGFNFHARVGKSLLTVSKGQEYGLMHNGTHFSLVVPFASSDVVFEAVEESAIRTRIDLTLTNPETGKTLNDFSLACNFPSTLAECLPNGTITALAVKLDSVPSLNPEQLTLSDPSCGPIYSDERYAFFVFTANSCGTTRKFASNAILYENEISLPDNLVMAKVTTDGKQEEPEYELKIACYYDISSSQAVSVHTRPRRSEPYADDAHGDLHVQMQLATDDSYAFFYGVQDFPLSTNMQQPLFFQVELMNATNPKVSLELESCWATSNQDRMSRPRKMLLINGCTDPADPYQVTFHPVGADVNIKFPDNIKRFEVQMYAFSEDYFKPNSQLFIHCDVLMCDPRNPINEACSSQCSSEGGSKVQRREVNMGNLDHVSFGPIRMNKVF